MIRISLPALVAVALVCGATPAVAQIPEVCDPQPGSHQFYRTQNTLLVQNLGGGRTAIWIGVEHRGIFRSTDDGATWQKRDTGLRGGPRAGAPGEICVRELGRIVADPDNPRQLFALRVETPGRLDMPNSEYGGVFRTTDAGATWTQLTGYANAGGGHALAVVRGGSAPTVFIGSGNSQASWGGAPPGFYNTTGVLFKSTDGGTSWTELDQRAGTPLIDEYLGASQVYVDTTGQRIWMPAYKRSATGGPGVDASQVGFLQSEDGGITWTRGISALPDSTARGGLDGHVAPANFDHRYLVATNTPPSLGAINGPAANWFTLDGVTYQKSSRYMHVARYTPHDPQGLTLLGYDPFSGPPSEPTQGIHRSVDGGATWTRIGDLPPGIDNSGTGVRLSNFAFHPTDPSVVYASGSGAHVWRSNDGGVTWTTLVSFQAPLFGGDGVADTVPGTPSAPSGTYAGTTLTLRWSPPAGGGAPASYLVQTASDAAFTADVTQHPVSDADEFPSAVIDVGTTTASRYVRVVAVNASGEGPRSPVQIFRTMSPRRVVLAATKNGSGGALVFVSSVATVTVPAAGSVPGPWTASSTAPWLSIAGASGSGAGVFSLSVINPDNVIGDATQLTGTVRVFFPDTATRIDLDVSLAVYHTPDPGVGPIGRVDSPAQNMTGVQGALALTGWAVDDIGIDRVRIYRQCLELDHPLACQMVLGARVVFIGDASIVPGARPDVEAAFPTLPATNAAGWGFLILSNMLPHIPNGLPNGGVGTFQLYAVARDKEGHEKLLGRTAQSSEPTTVTATNDTIAKPFGTIDTPGQGATVAGIVNNFGWVLTPDTSALGTLMPLNGSTIQVFVDGGLVGTVQYNLCRGSVGSTVPIGVLCDDDVSTIFRGDGTRFRNLDTARGPIGLRSINTTTLANGLHTLSWGVTDSANRVEGIGSRYFTVLNSGADAAADPGTSGLRDSGTSGLRDPGTPIWARTGFDVGAAYTPLEPNADGVPQVRIPEHGRVELQIPGVMSGVLLANGTARALPIGVAIDRERGVVTWVAGPGYLGTYRLSFVVQGPTGSTVQGAAGSTVQGSVVDVTVSSASTVGSNVRMRVDRADVHGAAFTLHGWALDPQAATGAGIGTVHVWGRKRSPEVPESRSPEVSAPIFLGVAQLGVSRPDVAAAHGAHYPNAGFVLQGVLPEAGEWEITAYVWVARTGRFEDARTVTVVR